MKKRITALLLSMVLATGGIFVNAYADENDTDVIIRTGTQQTALDNETNVDEDIIDGVNAEVLTEWEDIHIRTPEDLIELSLNARLDTWSRNKHVYLDNDISLAGAGFSGIPTFGGTFDGQGHTISGYSVTDGISYIGFFVYLQEDAIVKNLNVEGRIAPSGKQVCVGGIAGDNYGVITDCSFNGVVSGSDYVGGVAGFNELSGIISDCASDGYITGTHFTGGIAGENMGNIVRCRNSAKINTTDRDTSLSLDEINLESYAALLDPDSNSKSDEASMADGVVDAGGIAGLSIGIIQHCINDGEVGYEKIGYNIGGIVGRQSGYLYDCKNNANVLGRKDVGGIAGQAEPYVTVDLTQDIAYQLSENIEKLHGLITTTLNNAGDESDTISARLSIIQQFTGNALDDTRYLADGTVNYANGITGAVNEAFSRVEYILDESSKKDGALDQVSYSASNVKSASKKLSDTVGDLDIYDYLSDSEKEDYDANKKKIEDATKEYNDYIDASYDSYYNYYMLYYAGNTDYPGTGDLAYKDNENGDYTFNKQTINIPADKAASAYTVPATALHTDAFVNEFKKDGDWSWVHHRENDPDYEDITVPEDTDEQRDNDASLMEKAAEETATSSRAYADAKYTAEHGSTYSTDVSNAAQELARIIEAHLPEMSEDARADAEEAVSYLESASSNLETAGRETKNIVSNIAGRSDIKFPELDAAYRAHTTSLSDNMQGMNDNFGYLNTEVNNASDELLKDLEDVFDQFNTIMLLYTDAIDGVLDMDYSNVIEDNSLEVAQTCTDATIASCSNYGSVSGSLNVSGIAGTMAIEYDFDLESDITGIKDANMNTTYITKCVLRDNKNYGEVVAEKSYAGGICGLQEMGTILECEGYSDITSNSGNYVGGIAGSSLSYIVRSFAKCRLSAEEYVGGIAGDGTNIYDSASMVTVDDAKAQYGAIAGHIGDDGRVRNNIFVSDELAGIDRVSYSLKATPVSYSELLSEDEVPYDFGYMTVTFLLDDEDSDEEKVILGKARLKYDDRLESGEYPAVPQKDGYYVVWDIDGMESVKNDEYVTASYVRNVTTLAGATLLGSGQSSVLVDGAFKEGDELEATKEIAPLDAFDDTMEYWDLIIPDDGHNEHMLRYIPGDEYRDEIDEDFKIYTLNGGQWEEIPRTGTMGAYYLYELTGNNVKMQVRSTSYKNLRKRYIIIAVLIGLAALAAAGLILFFLIKKRKKIAAAVDGIHKATQNAMQNMASQNQLFYHGEEDEHGDAIVPPSAYDEPIDELDVGTDDDNPDDSDEAAYIDNEVYDE